MKHKHFIGNLLLASSVLFSFSSCLGENDDKFKEEEQKREQEKETWNKIQDVTISGQVDGYSYVDLGLSIKWATYNVGASEPTENGDHFSWGEISPKEDYSIDKYKWSRNNGNDMTKYMTDNIFKDTLDNKTQLDPEDDAATMNWSENWRMPTAHEFQELINGCDWKANYNFGGSGAIGLVGVSKINGNVIFFPAAETGNFVGYLNPDFHTGYYWTSSLGEDINSYGKFFYFSFNISYVREQYELFEHCRFEGRSVRAVTK